MTQNQLTELLETEGARTMIEAGEERGWIERAELEAFALEHELAELDVEELQRELERIGLEVRESAPEEKAPKAEEVVYEAYGHGGAALMIEATTDNRNRTVAEVRAALTRGGGSAGDKSEAMKKAGIAVADSPAALGSAMVKVLKG